MLGSKMFFFLMNVFGRYKQLNASSYFFLHPQSDYTASLFASSTISTRHHPIYKDTSSHKFPVERIVVASTLVAGNLCLEANHAAGSSSARSRGRGGTSLLDGDAATEGASVAGVDELDNASVGLAGNVTRAGGASGNVDLEGVVLVDVGGTLHDANSLEGTSPEALLGLLDVTLGARHLGLDIHGGPGVTGTVGVDHGLVWAGTVGGDDVQGAGDGAAVGGDLGESGAGLDHGGLGASLNVVVALSVGAAASVGSIALEDGGVGLRDLVLAGAGDHSSLDTEGGTVATGITGCDSDLAVGGNEGGGCESEDEELGEHFDGWWWWCGRWLLL